MKFGDNLKHLRKLKKLSQEELAEKVGVSRQSVSKWENAEAYPSMNNILQLCKIFHCRMNDLVNDHISDVEALDDEVKDRVVKFKKEQQQKMKGLSKMIMMIAKIGRILLLILLPIIGIVMLVFPFLVDRTTVNDQQLIFEGWHDTLKITQKEDRVVITYQDIELEETGKWHEVSEILTVFQCYSKTAIIGYIEIKLIFSIGIVVLMIIILKHLECLFLNINQGSTPFTLENVEHIKRMAYLMIAVILLPNIGGMLLESVLKMDGDLGLEMFDFMEILFLFSMAYVFQYGYEIQLDSKGTMYDITR